ncbi:MAG: hypothetical protein SF123_26325 [Chloroflexota bacterium]|nr:hypothetical protein [Chloroflexota bacterium]
MNDPLYVQRSYSVNIDFTGDGVIDAIDAALLGGQRPEPEP